MDRIFFDNVWEELKNESEESKIVYQTAEELSCLINTIIEARVSRGITQRELASKCGLKQAAIARMESLKTIPRIDTLLKITNALSLKINVLPDYMLYHNSTVCSCESLDIINNFSYSSNAVMSASEEGINYEF